jgi:hypothetical protein
MDNEEGEAKNKYQKKAKKVEKKLKKVLQADESDEDDSDGEDDEEEAVKKPIVSNDGDTAIDTGKKSKKNKATKIK